MAKFTISFNLFVFNSKNYFFLIINLEMTFRFLKKMDGLRLLEHLFSDQDIFKVIISTNQLH